MAFYDTRLSTDDTISCSTCHPPENAFSEPTPVSTGDGGQQGGRKAPTFLNAAWPLLPHFFWDGRADSLEAEALGPIENPIEMGHTIDAMIATLNEGAYSKYFEEATEEFADIGRFAITGQDPERGAFKTSTIRDVTKHSPYMQDGSVATPRGSGRAL